MRSIELSTEQSAQRVGSIEKISSGNGVVVVLVNRYVGERLFENVEEATLLSHVVSCSSICNCSM